MRHAALLKNTIMEYPWGSLTAIPDLLGIKTPTSSPQAELWMGAHPKAPSMVMVGDAWEGLDQLIEKHPRKILGDSIDAKFKAKLPYLFKVLAAARPLSIQAHPNKAQAIAGFERENSERIPIDAPDRNYRDNNHKPECICALSPFWAMCGFRKAPEIISRVETILPQNLAAVFKAFKSNPGPKTLSLFFMELMSLKENQLKEAVAMTVETARKLETKDHAFQWVLKLHEIYKDDMGIFSPLLLNLVCLQPGQALYLPSGQLHAYLDGLGIELMANSDNVLRGGLTPKHMDLPELLKVLNFTPMELEILEPVNCRQGESVYQTPAEEFSLSLISLKNEMTYKSNYPRGVEIILCVKGSADLIESRDRHRTRLKQGTSVIVPVAAENYILKGNGIFYMASPAR